MSVNIKPLADRVLIEPVAAEQTTASGIIIPDTAKEKPQRNPGLVGATLDCAMPYGLIADGVHVHPAALKIALAAHGPGAVLVSDAMALTGSAADHFTLAGRPVSRRNGRLELADGTLAGADLTLVKAVENIAAWTACDLADAAAMATARPLVLTGRAHPTPSRWVIWQGGRATARIDSGALLPLAQA